MFVGLLTGELLTYAVDHSSLLRDLDNQEDGGKKQETTPAV